MAAIARPSTDTRPSTDGLGPPMAPNSAADLGRHLIRLLASEPKEWDLAGSPRSNPIPLALTNDSSRAGHSLSGFSHEVSGKSIVDALPAPDPHIPCRCRLCLSQHCSSLSVFPRSLSPLGDSPYKASAFLKTFLVCGSWWLR